MWRKKEKEKKKKWNELKKKRTKKKIKGKKRQRKMERKTKNEQGRTSYKAKRQRTTKEKIEKGKFLLVLEKRIALIYRKLHVEVKISVYIYGNAVIKKKKN